jgi:hypothetical protein
MYVVFCVDWYLLGCRIVVVDHKDGECVGIFLSCHANPMNGFYRCIIIRGCANPMPCHLEDCACPREPNSLS